MSKKLTLSEKKKEKRKNILLNSAERDNLGDFSSKLFKYFYCTETNKKTFISQELILERANKNIDKSVLKFIEGDGRIFFEP